MSLSEYTASSPSLAMGISQQETVPYDYLHEGNPVPTANNDYNDTLPSSPAPNLATAQNKAFHNQHAIVEEGFSEADVYGNGGPFFDYRNLIGSIAQKLRKENAMRLAYVYDLPNWYYEVGPTHDPTSALGVLIALEGKGVFAPTNLSGLIKALQTIEREDLVHMVRDFRKLKNNHTHHYALLVN